MMMFGHITVCVIFFFPFSEGIATCGSCVDSKSIPSTYTVKTYRLSDEHVQNPHRGFAVQLVTSAHHHVPLTTNRLDDLRQHNGTTIIWRSFVLDAFVTSSISDDYLSKIRHDFDVIESSGFTVVPKFCYIFEERHHSPYGDASKNIVLRHISQLKPIFHRYERIITSIMAGFIGAWGEWHNSEYFGNPQFDTPGHDPLTGLMPQALRDRKDVLLAIVHAAPSSVQVQIRSPAQKMHFMGSTPTSFQDVQRGEDKARIGHHNGCFLLTDADAGTYKDKATEYPFLQHDTRYVVMGGETCGLSKNHRHECPTATKEMAMFHWTWMNQAYSKDVLNVWRQQGCYAAVDKKLGYRITISKAILPKTAHVDDNLCFHLEFDNHGYAAPVKYIKFIFILKSTTNGQHYAAEVKGLDVRDWQPGYTHTVASSVHLTHVPGGQYKVLLALSVPVMGDRRAEYNVLLATTGVPLYTQGLNDLGHTITVSGQHPVSSSCPALSPWKPPASVHYSRVFHGPFN